MIGTPHNLKIIAQLCFFAPGISRTWPNTAELAVTGKSNLGSNHETCRNTAVTWVHTRMETPEAQEHFLDCDGRANLRPYKNPSTAKGPALKNLFQKQNRGVGKDVVMITKTYTINIFIHFLTTESPKILRGCSRNCSSHPRPPSPRGAAGLRNRGRWGLRSAAVCCLGAAARGQATGRSQTKGRNFWDDFGASSQSFENWGHSCFFLDLS